MVAEPERRPHSSTHHQAYRQPIVPILLVLLVLGALMVAVIVLPSWLVPTVPDKEFLNVLPPNDLAQVTVARLAIQNEIRRTLVTTFSVILVLGIAATSVWIRMRAAGRIRRPQTRRERLQVLGGVGLVGVMLIVFLWACIVLLPALLYPQLSSAQLDRLPLTPEQRLNRMHDRLWLQHQTRRTLLGGVGIAILVSGAAVTLSVRSRSVVPGAESPVTVRDRARRLTKAIQEAITALDVTYKELQHDVDQSEKLVTKLEEDARIYEELAAVNREQAEAVANVVRGEVKAEGRRSFWPQFWLQFAMGVFFFVLGVVATVLMGP